MTQYDSSSSQRSGRHEARDVVREILPCVDALLASLPPGTGPARQCLEIERALMEPGFGGLPLGSTLTDSLGSLFYRKVNPTGAAASARELGAYVFHAWRGVRVPPGGVGGPTGLARVILATISSRSYNRRWAPAVSRLLAPQDCLVITDDSGLRQLLPTGTSSLRWSNMPGIDMPRWRRVYREGSRRRRDAIGALRRRYGFSRLAALTLEHALLVSSQWMCRAARFLDATMPSAVLVEYDRNTRGACLVLAARQRGIPTMTLMHGVINGPFGYTPVLAERVLCWGTLQREQLISLGTPPGRIDVVGYPPLDPGLSAERPMIRRRLGISEDAVVALLATNPVGLGDRMRLATLFCEAVLRVEGVCGVVRLHPSESMSAYQDVRGRYPGVRFTANQEMTLEEAIVLGDVSVVHASGFGGEALAMGGLCIVLDALQRAFGHAEDLTRRGGVPSVQNGEELAALLERIRDDAAYRSYLREEAHGFVRAQYHALGDAACRNIASVVQEHTAGSGARGPLAADSKPEPVLNTPH